MDLRTVSVPLRGKYRGKSYQSESYTLCGFQGSIFAVHLTFVYKRTRKQKGNIKLFSKLQYQQDNPNLPTSQTKKHPLAPKH